MPDISGLNGGVVKATPDGTDLLPIQEVGGLTKPVSIASVATAAAALVPIATPSVAGKMSAVDKTKLDGLSGGLSQWQFKTASYTALPGDKLRLDATAGDVVITLPASPTATDADILFQRLDLGTNKVLLRTGANKFNTQANQDAVFAPPSINLIEGISYVNNAIGWLNQHNRLTFQAYIPPTPTGSDSLFASVVFLLIPSGADNTTVFVDRSSSAKAITTVGNAKILSNQAVFNGSGDNLTANASIDFTMTADFTIEGKFKCGINPAYATFVSRGNPGFNAGAWTALQDPTGRLAIFWADFSTSAPIFATINPINDNTVHDFAWVRSGNNLMLFLDGVLQASVGSSASMANAVGNLAIATDLYFSGRYYAGSIAGIRITKGVARYTSNYTPLLSYPTS